MGEQDEVATLSAAIGGLDGTSAGLRGHFWRALARPSLAEAADAARDAGADAADLARDRLARGDAAGAFRALEAARGLALYAATEIRPAADHLAHAGKLDLARQWQAAASVADPHRLPSDLRREVLTTLLARSPAAALLTPPSIAEVQSALARTQADALVHLVAGHAVIVPVGGPVTQIPLPGLTPAIEHIERFLGTLALHNAFDAAGIRSWHVTNRQSPDVWPENRQSVSLEMWPEAGRPRPEVGGALQALGRWAWDAVVGPVLDHLNVGRPRRSFPGAAPVPIPALGGLPGERVPRIVLIAPGDLARVPWSAARRSDGTYAVQLMAISQAASARMLCHNAALPPLPPSAAGLIVADPDTGGQARELPAARLEAYAISRSIYPQARFTGRRPDGTASPSGAGTLDQVRAWLSTTSPAAGGVLHLATPGYARTGADAYALMAGGERLTATEILSLNGRAQRRPIDLVVLAGGRTGLSMSGFDESFALGTAFLAGGTRSVLATRWTPPSPALLFMTHLYRRQGRPVWAAVRAAQLWMLDPHRETPAEMPAELARGDAADPLAWASVTHWGR
jgi:hypothetical protein